MMLIRINTQGLLIGPGDELRIQHQLEQSLHRFANRIRAVDLYLKDINGPRKGDDKNVVMHVRLRGGNEFTVRALRSRLFCATRLAARRAKRRIKKVIQRQYKFGRRPGPQGFYGKPHTPA